MLINVMMRNEYYDDNNIGIAVQVLINKVLDEK